MDSAQNLVPRDTDRTLNLELVQTPIKLRALSFRECRDVNLNAPAVAQLSTLISRLQRA